MQLLTAFPMRSFDPLPPFPDDQSDLKGRRVFGGPLLMSFDAALVPFKQRLHRDGCCRVATVPDLVVEIRCKIVGWRATKIRSLGVGS